MLTLKVWAEHACFTRPENKVERVTYDVMTPSAARGVLEAIFWKPQIRWKVREIWVLKPIRHHSILRNEVNSTASASSARKWVQSGGGYFAEEDRAQRHALILRDVEYIIHADLELLPHATDPIQKYLEMFRRRAEKGQAHHQPYLGNREFTASFSPIEGHEKPIDVTDDLGRMLFDVQYSQSSKGKIKFMQHDAQGSRVASGVATPRFFQARLEKGILHVPQELYGGA
ncbi:type I-C CRISPR-associated protein Cas5c [Deinococcus cellulosilyticus]|uniref:pre-crRNA processing endonuclease n=1 Tax=Deinococcus cellulosilyticus (strain DSM 18568 / NBRC 106333 / KACC 11606 / 5516J-15) TaxID=1223518 RepID=A0A511N1I6_DEIC1|nr:type I-C CRISPR-associated protein Cas5c [Deinococcus cellulosilyticus]GEM46311.1 type I-C CRISPR-associated protein Cas5 [Deinococcus cellulosilyticus NBRC 106333 = KACC 11606]